MLTLTRGLVDAVAEYLARRAEAEVVREAVDAVYSAVLAERPVMVDAEYRGRRCPAERITTQAMLHMASDSGWAAVCEAATARLLADGIKPADMDPAYCPALVAEERQHKAAVRLIHEGAPLVGEEGDPEDFRHALLCAGLDKYHEFIDLLCRLAFAGEREGVPVVD